MALNFKGHNCQFNNPGFDREVKAKEVHAFRQMG